MNTATFIIVDGKRFYKWADASNKLFHHHGLIAKQPDAFLFKTVQCGRQKRKCRFIREDMLQFILKTQRDYNTAGVIYCFKAHVEEANHVWIKVGHTMQLQKRLASYGGPACVGKIICIFESMHRCTDEGKILAALSEFSGNKREWFRVPKTELPSFKKRVYNAFESL